MWWWRYFFFPVPASNDEQRRAMVRRDERDLANSPQSKLKPSFERPHYCQERSKTPASRRREVNWLKYCFRIACSSIAGAACWCWLLVLAAGCRYDGQHWVSPFVRISPGRSATNVSYVCTRCSLYCCMSTKCALCTRPTPNFG